MTARPRRDSDRGPIPVEAVVFDMDGTLIHSDYDWPAIRRELRVEGPSIIDALNDLPEDRRRRAWARMEALERVASANAALVDGAVELVAGLRQRGIRTALVTNNTAENTSTLMERFGLSFDVTITRDSGLYKPSAAPVVEAMRRMGVKPGGTIAVGDSNYDIRAARAAGCAMAIVVNGGCGPWGDLADRAFENLVELRLFFEGDGTAVVGIR